MVSVPTCSPAKVGATITRIRTASVVPLSRIVPIREDGAAEDGAALWIDEEFVLRPRTAARASTNVVAMIKIRGKRFLHARDKRFPERVSSCSGGAGSLFNSVTVGILQDTDTNHIIYQETTFGTAQRRIRGRCLNTVLLTIVPDLQLRQGTGFRTIDVACPASQRA